MGGGDNRQMGGGDNRQIGWRGHIIVICAKNCSYQDNGIKPLIISSLVKIFVRQVGEILLAVLLLIHKLPIHIILFGWQGFRDNLKCLGTSRPHNCVTLGKKGVGYV